MRTIIATLLALGFVGAMSVGLPSPAKAQGYYYSGPGVEVEVGDPRWRYRRDRRYYREYGYGGPYAYQPPGGYRTWNGCRPGFTVQDGLCKPYRGY